MSQQLDWLDLMSPEKKAQRSNSRSAKEVSLTPSDWMRSLYKPLSPTRYSPLTRRKRRTRGRSCPRLMFHEAREKYFSLRRKMFAAAAAEGECRMDIEKDATRLGGLRRSNSCPSVAEPPGANPSSAATVVAASAPEPMEPKRPPLLSPQLRRGSSVGKNMVC